MSGPHSSEQITKAQAFAQKIQAGTYSPATQAKIAQATQYATFFDIETGGLDPKKHPIYEMGFQHGTGPNARFTHHFVNPGSAPIDPWSEAYMAKREAESNGNFRIALSQGLSQRDAAQQAYSELAGRDIWVQNLRHERTFLNTRTGKHGFNEWARNARLESFTDGAGLYPTTPGLKNYIAEASRQNFVGDTQSVLNAWEDVFTKGFAPALENRQAGVTRAFDIMDLTKSVFAMAQNRGHMAKTGELFTGTSVDTFSREMFGIEELHEALPDNVMQSSMVERFLGAGYAMQNGEALDPQTAGFFKRLGEAIPQIKHHNTVKGIARTFADQQEFLATVAEGKPNYELLKGARTTFDNVGVQLGLNVIQPDGSYAKENTEFYLREKQNPRLAGGVNTEHYSTDIGEVVRARKARDAKLPGVKANWDAAYEQATQNYIRPYQEALATNRGAGMSESEAIRAALKSVEEHAVKLENAPKASLEAILKEAPSSTKASNFLKRNWKVGLGIFGAVIAANYISSKDDDYNYLEGLRHGGIAGETRKHNTDFGSGWQGLLEGAKNFITKHPKTVATIGAGAAANIAMGGHRGEREDSSSTLGTIAKGIAISGGALLLASPVLAGIGAAQVRKATGMGPGFGTVFKEAFKTNWELVKGTVGSIGRIHMGESGKGLLAEAEAKGIDISLGAQIKRGFEGPYNVAKNAAHHTAEWLGKHWAPKAEQLDPAAMLLAGLSGYEAVGIGRDISEGNIGGALWGVAKFAGAKYAYMGWHYRNQITQAWKLSTKRDKLLVGSQAATLASNIPQTILEGIHASFAYGRYGLNPQEFYPRIGGEVLTGLQGAGRQAVDSVTNLVPELSPEARKALSAVALKFNASIEGGVKTASQTTKEELIEKINEGVKGFSEALRDKGDNKESYLGKLLANKVDKMDQDKIYGMWQSATSRAKDKMAANSEQSEEAVKRLKEALGKYFNPEEMANIDEEIKMAKMSRSERDALHKQKREARRQEQEYKDKLWDLDQARRRAKYDAEWHESMAQTREKYDPTDPTIGEHRQKAAEFRTQFSGFDDEYLRIEALRHPGGKSTVAERRQSMTDFGSGWRGIIKVLKEDAFSIYGLGAQRMAGGVTMETAEQLVNRTVNRPSEHLTNQLKQAQSKKQNYPILLSEEGLKTMSADWEEMHKLAKSDPAGFQKSLENMSEHLGVKVSLDDFIRGNRDRVKATIKHERFHQKLRTEHGSTPIRGEAPASWNELAARRYGDQPETWYEEYLAHKEEFSHYPESLLHSDPEAYSFFRKRELAGEYGELPARRRRRIAQERANKRILRNGPPEAPGRIQSNISSNTIVGQQEESQITGKKGFGAKLRKLFGFGSPWQGMKMMFQDVMQEVTEYSSRQSALEGIRRRQEEREQNKRGRTLEGLNGGFDGPIADMEIDDYSVEDADTISIQMANGNQVQMRLAGIDAPEISHENDDGSRIWQDQPYGQQAKSNLQALLASQKNLTAVIDPLASQSYGRTVGMIYGDNGQNINLELVRQGSAAALPFGKAREQIAGKKEFMQAESDAAAAQQGMWDYESWQISRQLQEDSKRRITNTSYTDLGRLFSNFKTSSILMRMRNPDSEMADMEAAGGKDDFNIIEGMKHGWVGASRKMNTDFGSGYQVLDGIIPSLSSTARTTRKLRQSHMLSTTRMRMNMKRSNLVKHHIG